MSPAQLCGRQRDGVSELRAEPRGHPRDQSEQRAARGPARLLPFGGQGGWIPSYRVGVWKGRLELFHIYFLIMTTAPVLNLLLLSGDAGGSNGYCRYYMVQ